MSTGENEQGLRKITDMTRMMSVFLLVLHGYFECYGFFKAAGMNSEISDRILSSLSHTGLFSSFDTAKLIALCMLLISLIGMKGKVHQKLSVAKALFLLVMGILIYFSSRLLFSILLAPEALAVLYLATTVLGFLLVIAGGTMFSRIVRRKLDTHDIFNLQSETFPQEQRLLENEYSVNLPAEYLLNRKKRSSWINIINPFRGVIVMGSPGSGKSYFVIRHFISQHLQKGFAMFVYDFKFDDLSRITYNHYLKNAHRYAIRPSFYVINFDDLSRSHRCNPLDKDNMVDLTDAAESARTILMGLNREWIRKQGDFFVESAINFVTAIIWYLRKYQDGIFCTLPHVIELMQVDYDRLFSVLQTEKEIEILINPFMTAYLNNVMEQLEGQVASAKISMARLSSPQLYYILSGNDFSLDINNPNAPKIVCMGNNPQKVQTYGAVLSLYVNRLIKLVNKKHQLKSSLIFDEFPTIYLNNMDSLIATARSNKVAACLGIQDVSQLRKDYGREQADVIMNISGNVISGQVTGDTAKQLSERFGKIMQHRESISTNRNDSSVSESRQLEYAIPASKIAALSSGEFVGMVADDPDNKISLKMFHCEVKNDHQALKREESAYHSIPQFKKIDQSAVQLNYYQIKKDVDNIFFAESHKKQ